MRRHRRWLVLWGCAAVAGTISFGPRAHASMSFDNQRGDIAARVATQNTFQHNNADSINWVQWRNEVRFDLRYDLIQPAQAIGPLDSLKFNILWRGRYDAVYQLRDTYKRRDYNRGDLEFPEGETPRELFFDLGFSGALKDLSLRIGKQQVVWGESDLFRSLDVVNPLDLRQNIFVGEDFADFRQPLWIFKALYNIGNVANFWNEAGVEAFWSPNATVQTTQESVQVGETWKLHVGQSIVQVPGTQSQGFNFNRNMTEPFRQIRPPFEFLRVGALNGDSPAVVQLGGTEANFGGEFADFMYRIKNDTPTSLLSFDRMMAGVRLLGTTYGNAYFTLNYLFKRSDSASAEANPGQLADINFPGSGPGSGQTNPLDVQRAINASLTPDLNGNGIPDGTDQQIANCLRSIYPTQTGFTNLPGGTTVGNVPLPPQQGEVMLDPVVTQVILGLPVKPTPWHGSVYSNPDHPNMAVGVPAGTFGVPAGTNQIQQVHVPYKPVLPLTGFTKADGLSHFSFCQDIPVFHPWTHIIGGSATYNDYDFTGLVFRLEQSFSTKEPAQFSAVSPERLLMQKKHCPTNADGFPECTGGLPGGSGPPANIFNAANNTNDFETRAKRYNQVWRSMVGFDYLKAIAPQFGKNCKPELIRSLLSDQWFFTFQFLNTYYSKFNQIDHSGSFTDRFQQFNPFLTLAGTGFFMHQTLRPTLAAFMDVNQLWPGFFVQTAYFLTPKLEMRLGEVLFAGSSRAQDNGGLSYFADRDTFYVRLTYFLA